MITTRNIANIGSPPDDPTCPLEATLYIPDPAIYPGPYDCFVGTQAAGFDHGGLGPYGKVFGTLTGTGLALKGFLCLAFNCRTLTPKVGQTTDGTWPQQTNDCKIAVRYMRTGAEIETLQGFDVTGFVGIIGGSGSGGHALYIALDGTAGDDKADVGIGLSPVTDMSDRPATSAFVTHCQLYGDSTDLAVLLSKSPIALDLASAPPILHFNGDDESMPVTQLTLFQAAMASAGAVGYTSVLSTGAAGKQHSFGTWDFHAEQVNTWAVDRAAEWNGNEPPPPPEETGQVLVTVAITNLAPGQELELVVTPKNIDSGLEGPASTFDFVSDPATVTGLKDAPSGVFVELYPVGLVPGEDLSGRAWWDFAYVDGARYGTYWSALHTARTSINFAGIDAFLDLCVSKSKFGGVSVDAGIHCPSWLFTGPQAAESVAVTQPNAGTIPLPWDTNYIKSFKNFIARFAAQYDGNPNLRYVIMGGLGQLLDTILCRTVDYSRLNALALAAGYTDAFDGWRRGAQSLMDTWVKSMPNTRCYMAIELPVPATNGGLTGIDTLVRASITRYGINFGLTNLELDGLTAASGALSLNSIIRDAVTQPRGYQFLWPSSNPACDPSQLGVYDPELGLRNAANAGIAIGVQMEEFKEADILTVAGAYPADFAQFQTDLIANTV